jgi:tetratricopeptide (TPR) repeat protein
MKSRHTFFFIAMAGIAVLTDPVISHAVTQKKSKNQQSKAQLKNSPSVKISMGSFRDGTLDKQASLKLAAACFSAKEYNDGEEVIDTLLELYPNDELILNKAIDLFLSAQNAEKALPLFDQLLKIDPKNTQLTTKAARAYSWTGRWETALKLLDSVVNAGDTSDAIQREYADVLYNNKQYAKAAARYQKIFETNKQKDYAIAFTYKLAAAKEYAEAGKLLNSIEKQYPRDPSVLETKANLALGRQDFSEALKISEELIKRSPKNHTNKTALLIKAEISSWQKDYKTSLANYDKLITQGDAHKSDFFQLKAYREKGRVLGWMAKYGQATAVYDEAVRAYPQSEGLKAEAKAKKNYYRNSYRPAVTAYKEWLIVEPNEAEALFDLGQLYMQNAKWRDATQTYQQMLTLMPGHQQAALAKQKTNILSSMKLLQSGAEYFNVKSEWKSINFSSTGLYTSLSYPFQDNLSGFMQLEKKSFNFESSQGSISQNNIMTGFEYRTLPDILVRGAYAYHANSQNVENSHTGFLETQSEPLNNIHLGLAFRREEVIDNANTFRNHLQRDRWQSRLIYDGYRNWNAGVDYDVANYSDGNSSLTTGADFTAHLLFGQKRLNLTYRLQNYGFSDVSAHNYWTPSSFTTHALGIELRNYFNDELYQGVNETYYTTSYKIIAEPASNVSHQIRATLYHDWSNRFSTSIEGQYSWATKAFYEDKLLKTDIRWFF